MTIKIMVIDDSSTIRKTAETLLKRAGFEVITAADGFEATRMIMAALAVPRQKAGMAMMRRFCSGASKKPT